MNSESFKQGFNLDENETDVESDALSDNENSIEEEIEVFKEKAQKLLERYKTSMESFSGNVIPQIKFSGGVLMDFESMTVHLDTLFFKNKGFSDKQMIWAAYHELAHFRDLLSDPDKFLKNFEHIKEKAEEYGQKIRDISGTEKKEFTEEEKKKGYMDPADKKAYKSWHTFYNCVDDVYVNSLVERGVPFVYGKLGRHSEEVYKLYDEILFNSNDFSSLPKSRQFSYFILRKAMLPDQEIILEDSVKEVIDTWEIDFGDNTYSIAEIIEKVKAKKRSGIKAGDRYFMIRKTLGPVFEELYREDLKNWEEEQEKQENEIDESEEGSENEEQESGGGKQDDETENEEKEDEEENGSEQSEEGEQGDDETESGEGSQQDLDDEFNPDNENDSNAQNPTIPDFDPNNGEISPDELEDILQKIEDYNNSEEQEESDEPTFEEQARQRDEQQKIDWCERNNVEVETYKDFERIQKEIEPYIKSLSQVWNSIIYGQGTDFEKTHIPANQGELNINRVIKHYADIISGQSEQVRPMDKREYHQLPSNKPEVIRIRFIGDASGSMNDAKKEVLKKVYVLLMTSLRDFETRLNRTRGKTKSKLTVQTEGWLFGSTAFKLKSFRKGKEYNTEQAEIIRQFSEIGQDLGWTYDNTVLSEIEKSITPKDTVDIKKQKIMDIAFEVTDGGSSDADATKKLVDDLDKKGMIIRSFQIGKTGSDEDEIFKDVWGEKGFKIGEDIENLVPAIAGALKEYLSDVRI